MAARNDHWCVDKHAAPCSRPPELRAAPAMYGRPGRRRRPVLLLHRRVLRRHLGTCQGLPAGPAPLSVGVPWTARTLRRAALAATAELTRDPRRSDAAVAWSADAGRETVRLARRDLEASGVIPVIPVSERAARPRPLQPSRTRLAIEAGATTSRQVANLSGTSIQAAWKARRLAERRLAQAATDERAARVTTGRAFAHLRAAAIPEPVELGSGCASSRIRNRHTATLDQRQASRPRTGQALLQVRAASSRSAQWSVYERYRGATAASTPAGPGAWRRARRAERAARQAASRDQAGTVA